MSEYEHAISRRRFLRNGLLSVTAVPAGALLAGTWHPARAQDKPKVSVDAAQAQALKYHKDASKVSSSARQDGAFCHNCQLYQGSSDSQWGGCTIFSGKLVSANGWCSAWVPAS